MTATVAESFEPLMRRLFGGTKPVTVRCWDGSRLEADPGAGPGDLEVVMRSPRALRHLLWAPGELGLARAYVGGDLDFEGPIEAMLALRDHLPVDGDHPRVGPGARDLPELWRVARATGALGRRPPLPPEEVRRLRGRRHSTGRDDAAVRSHYDVGNDFYRLVLGESMTYSCGHWPRADMTLDEAQASKYELISTKLGLGDGMRLLDVGCGWGGMAIHAARHHGVEAVGVTLSPPQADLARKRVAEAGLGDRVEIRVQDYRDIDDGPFDAISSIGMFEHVGEEQSRVYMGQLAGLVRPGGRVLNHAISRPPAASSSVDPNSFMGRYVFPDAALLEVGRVVSAMQEADLEVRDVESLREHYAATLRCWVANLEANWDEAVALVGIGRARVWRLYMAASAVGFDQNRTSIHQVLAVRTPDSGRVDIPRDRLELLGAHHARAADEPQPAPA